MPYTSIVRFGTHDPAHVENVEDAAQQEPGGLPERVCTQYTALYSYRSIYDSYQYVNQ